MNVADRVLVFPGFLHLLWLLVLLLAAREPAHHGGLTRLGLPATALAYRHGWGHAAAVLLLHAAGVPSVLWEHERRIVIRHRNVVRVIIAVRMRVVVRLFVSRRVAHICALLLGFLQHRGVRQLGLAWHFMDKE